jgi:hypothetical protein
MDWQVAKPTVDTSSINPKNCRNNRNINTFKSLNYAFNQPYEIITDKTRIVGKAFLRWKLPYIFGGINGERKRQSTLDGIGAMAIINYLYVKQHLV